MSATVPARVVSWLEGLSPERLAVLATEVAAAVRADGLVVHRESGDVPIPVVLTPESMDDAELDRLGQDAARLLAAAIRVATWSLGPDGGAARARLYHAFTPLEHACLARDPSRLGVVATARVDTFPDASGRPRALELNATIPAMQGYSDIVAHRWIRVLAAARGITGPTQIDELVARQGSNTSDLLASLLAHFARAGGRSPTPSILVVSRRADSQLGELKHYVRAFGVAGHRTRHAFVDELELDGQGRVTVGGEAFELVYRHIFARLVPDGSVLAKLLLDPGPNVVVLNPVLSPLEVKGTLALLHQALHDGVAARAYGLTADELDTIARLVPWTRLLGAGPTILADGSPVPDLPAWVTAHPERVVLKKSWDYGGKSVLIGPDTDDWAGHVARALAGDEAWIVQELVPPRGTRHLVALPEGPTWRELYVDTSAYTCHGVDARPRGGVCRASGSKIVNILGGGGLAPLVRRSVLEALFP